MEKILKTILALIMMLLPLLVQAADCDALYRQATTLRRTMTPAAQQKALTLFEEARDCYTEQEDRDRCQHQIDLCAQMLERLGFEPKFKDPAAETEPAGEPVEANEAPNAGAPNETPAVTTPAEEPAVEEPAAPADVEPTPAAETPAPTASAMAVYTYEETFNYKDNTAHTFTVAPDQNWQVFSAPGWVNVTIDGGFISINVNDLEGSEPRHGPVVIQGTTSRLQIEVIQHAKKKKYGLF